MARNQANNLRRKRNKARPKPPRYTGPLVGKWTPSGGLTGAPKLSPEALAAADMIMREANRRVLSGGQE
jgi:hypothetical protein